MLGQLDVVRAHSVDGAGERAAVDEINPDDRTITGQAAQRDRNLKPADGQTFKVRRRSDSRCWVESDPLDRPVSHQYVANPLPEQQPIGADGAHCPLHDTSTRQGNRRRTTDLASHSLDQGHLTGFESRSISDLSREVGGFLGSRLGVEVGEQLMPSHN